MVNGVKVSILAWDSVYGEQDQKNKGNPLQEGVEATGEDRDAEMSTKEERDLKCLLNAAWAIPSFAEVPSTFDWQW